MELELASEVLFYYNLKTVTSLVQLYLQPELLTVVVLLAVLPLA